MVATDLIHRRSYKHPHDKSDGYPDVVLVDDTINSLISYVNRGNGTFKTPQVIFEAPGEIGDFLITCANGDINGDGCADAVATDTFGLAEVFLGNCDGAFQNNYSTQVGLYGVGDVAFGAALTDVNGRGKLDLVTSGFVFTEDGTFGQIGGNMLSLMLGNGDELFTAPFTGEDHPWCR